MLKFQQFKTYSHTQENQAENSDHMFSEAFICSVCCFVRKKKQKNASKFQGATTGHPASETYAITTFIWVMNMQIKKLSTTFTISKLCSWKVHCRWLNNSFWKHIVSIGLCDLHLREWVTPVQYLKHEDWSKKLQKYLLPNIHKLSAYNCNQEQGNLSRLFIRDWENKKTLVCKLYIPNLWFDNLQKTKL